MSRDPEEAVRSHLRSTRCTKEQEYMVMKTASVKSARTMASQAVLVQASGGPEAQQGAAAPAPRSSARWGRSAAPSGASSLAQIEAAQVTGAAARAAPRSVALQAARQLAQQRHGADTSRAQEPEAAHTARVRASGGEANRQEASGGGQASGARGGSTSRRQRSRQLRPGAAGRDPRAAQQPAAGRPVRPGSRELACFHCRLLRLGRFHCRLLRLGQVPENSLASTAAFFDSAVHAWALWRRAPGLAPVAAAVRPCVLSVGGHAPKVPAARAGASAGGRRSGAMRVERQRPRAEEYVPIHDLGSKAHLRWAFRYVPL
ncbi:uncharacterized protein LOC120640088 [Panicum virgatum]|uniref:uncharacterized protein LOC120640088 n=1 Tax=Panicum virgatum TaxID=38727 RepID=UPI0019D513EB|nr:uncharacterized protein LOC120640088 [Panicum virgatum]